MSELEVKISNVNIRRPLADQNEINLQNMQVKKVNQLNKKLNIYKNQIENLMTQTEEAQHRVTNLYVCKNEKLLERLEPHLTNCFEVYADEIADALVDDLLDHEVNNIFII